MTSTGPSQSSQIRANPQGWRLPPWRVSVLVVAFLCALLGFVWSERDVLAGTEHGFLVEAPLGSEPKRLIFLDASVKWSFQGAGTSGPEVVADVAIPERRLNLRFAISRNQDDQLPASHVVELLMEPAKFPGRKITAVPTLSLRPTLRGRVTRLIGASVRVSEDRFWIALSSSASDRDFNLASLRDGNVLDLALKYETGRQAALVMQKGEPGRKAFKEAFAVWEAE